MKVGERPVSALSTIQQNPQKSIKNIHFGFQITQDTQYWAPLEFKLKMLFKLHRNKKATA